MSSLLSWFAGVLFVSSILPCGPSCHILELIIQKGKGKSSRKKFDIYTKNSQYVQVVKSKSIGKQCAILLVDCIANHRYKDALKLLWILCQDKASFSFLILKAGLIILQNLEYSDKNEKIQKFFYSIQNFKILNKKEIQLEYLMFTLKNDFYNAETSFKEIRSRKKKTGLRKHNKIDPIFVAYSDLLGYMALPDTSHDDSMTQNTETYGKVKLAFKNFAENSGEWDIFILKLIKMLELCGKEDEIEEILLSYVNKNPDYVNAYIYYCTYVYHTNPYSETLINYLEILTSLSPSDSRVLWLVEILNKREADPVKCMHIIFMFLDYPSNQNNLMAWRILLLSLQRVSRNKENYEDIKSMWKTRCRSWDWMYFNANKIFECSDYALISYKVAFLSYFHKKHMYIDEMLTRFPQIKERVDSLVEAKESTMNA